MKKFLIGLKDKVSSCTNQFLDLLVRNRASVFWSFITALIFTVISFRISIEDAKIELELTKKNVALELLVKDLSVDLKEQGEYMKFQDEVITSQREAIRQMTEVLKELQLMNDQLIDFLKSISKWPPDIKPINLNNIISVRE